LYLVLCTWYFVLRPPFGTTLQLTDTGKAQSTKHAVLSYATLFHIRNKL
jgi:hypothetical protein